MLDDALALARTSGQVALVSGEAGVGKTALVKAFCAAAAGVRVLTGRCDDLFAPRPLGPFADIAREVGGALRAAIDAGDQQAAFDSFLEMLNAAEQTTIVVLEDLQWADDATLDLLRFSARRLEHAPALLVVIFRDDVPMDHPLRRSVGVLTGPHVHRIQVDPLSAAAVDTLVDGRQIDAVALHEATGGNPFFVVEVLAAERWTIPTTIRDAVLTRAAALSRSARDALAAAAVLGTHATPQAVMKIAGCDDGAIESCLAAGLLDDHASHLAFRHDLSRLAVEGALTSWRRRALHAAAVDLLEGTADLVALANHAIAADDADAVLRLAPLAADECTSLGALRAAATLYAAAVARADALDDGERIGLFEAHARACHAIGDFDGARRSGEVVLTLMRAQGAKPLREGAWLWWMSSATCGESPVAALASLQQSLFLLEPLGDTIELARALGQAAGWAMVRSDVAATTAAAERGLPMAERFGDEELAVRFLDMMGCARLLSGDEAGMEEMLDALDRAERSGLHHAFARVCNNAAAGLDATWRPLEALPWIERALDVARRHEIAMTPSALLAARAESELKLGRWEHAAESLREAATDPYVSRGDLGYAASVLGTLRARRGDPGAEGALNEGLTHGLVSDLLQSIHPPRIGLAELAWLSGDLDTARAQVTALVPVHGDGPEPWRLGELALWCHRTGVTLPIDGRIAEPFELHIAGRHTDAAAIWDSRGCRYAAADALGDSDDEANLRCALDTLLELGAAPRATMVRRRLRETGAGIVRRGPRATTRANVGGLTAREAEVAGLLAARLSNAEIADRLVVSTKTVDHHVSSVLAKLGVPSRREVAAALAGCASSPQDGEVANQR